jgi:integrase/recombinase XerD
MRCCSEPAASTSPRSPSGSESTKTTHIYEHADPALKEQAIALLAPFGTKPGRYRPTDTLLAFLEDL